MRWSEWNERAFEQARERGCPVLLFLTASWCRFCRDLEREVLGEERVSDLVERRFVPVRVDKDRRPDIDARYSKGGWPTLAYLDDAGELIASDAYLEVDDLLDRLDVVADYYDENREAVRRRLAEAAESRTRPGDAPPGSFGDLQPDLNDWVVEMLLETADPVYGGWGSPQKFPHPEALDFALIRWSQTGDDRLRKLVLRSLRRMEQGGIHDRVEGGFYRYATARDWSAPHYEKMLDSNAQRLGAYLVAHQALGEPSFRETAEGILRYLETTLLDGSIGAYRGSQDADPAYAHLISLADRSEYGAPECDPTVYANWNAMAANSLLRAGVVFEEPEHTRRALRTLDFLVEELFDPRVGMYHYWDGSYHLPGLLTDQAYTLRALLNAVQVASENRYLETARRLADLTIENLRGETGGFYDTPFDPGARGILRQRNRSILENAVMAEGLLLLARLTRIEDYAEVACTTLASFGEDFKRYGQYVAGYARAVELARTPPVHVTIVGDPASDRAQALRQAALRPFISGRVVQVIHPRVDTDLLGAAGLPGSGFDPSAARAYVSRSRESFAETDDPERLPVLITRIERSR